jgi:hypothetical protein
MISKIKNIKPFILLSLFSLAFYSCQKDDSPIPKVNVLYSYDTKTETENVNKGYPGNIVRAEGFGLGNIKSIVFDNKVSVVFNQAFSSNLSFNFNVPYNELKGSRFGLQDVTFTNLKGEVVNSKFEILQPKPELLKFAPEIPFVGSTVKVEGSWFVGIISVTFGGVPVQYTRVTDKIISVVVPANATAGADLVVTTVVGSGSKFLDIDQGFDIVKVADFDGGGLRPINNWVPYGSFDALIYSNAGGTSGNYAQLTWAGNTNPGYNGCQSSGGSSFLSTTITNPARVAYLIDVNCGGAVGTKIDLLIVDDSNGNWAYSYTIANTGWQTIEAPLPDFGANYNPSNQSNGDPDPSKINQVKMTIAQNSGTVNPSKVQFDNIRFKVLR